MSKNNPPKVAILIPSFGAGGTERVIISILAKLGADFDFHLVLFDEIIQYELPESFKVTVISESRFSQIGLIKVLMLPLLTYRYYKFCKKENIDVSLSFLYRANFVNGILKYFPFKGKTISCERSYASIYYKKSTLWGKVGFFLVEKLYPLSDILTANSYLSAIDLNTNFRIKKKILTIYNPVDIDKIRRLAKDPVTGFDIPRKFTFVCIERLHSDKNHTCLLYAFSKLKATDSQLILVGEGDMAESLKALAVTLNISERVIFIGFDPNPYKYLALSDCCVLSTDFHGFPNVILEAQAVGLPVISTDCRSGPREIFAPGSDILLQITDHVEYAEFGVLTPIKNADLFAEAMQKLYDDRQLLEKYSERSLERVKDFSIQQTMGKFKDVLSA